MAIDSWLLDQHSKGQASSLRFYTWREPTISLGYHQRQFPEHWKTLAYKGQSVTLVRRPTGGRAVLHQGDLTYALITSAATGSRRETYRQLCEFLIEGWQRLGVTLAFGTAGRGYIKNPNCFGSATAADLVLPNGYKFIGSAQAYREGSVLQHGSMRISPDSELFHQVFGEAIASSVLPDNLRATSERRLCRIAQSLTVAASDRFHIRFNVQPLTRQEIQAAMQTYAAKLGQPLRPRLENV